MFLEYRPMLLPMVNLLHKHNWNSAKTHQRNLKTYGSVFFTQKLKHLLMINNDSNLRFLPHICINRTEQNILIRYFLRAANTGFLSQLTTPLKWTLPCIHFFTWHRRLKRRQNTATAALILRATITKPHCHHCRPDHFLLPKYVNPHALAWEQLVLDPKHDSRTWNS